MGLYNYVAEKMFKNLFDFGKSEAIQATRHVINKGHEVFEQLQFERITIDELVRQISPTIDETILSEMAKNNSLIPIGGEFKLLLDKKTSNVSIIWEFYFIDAHQKYIKIGSQDILDKELFEQGDYNKIKMTSPVFKIDPPK